MPSPITYITIKARQASSFKYWGALVQDDGQTPIPNGSLQTLTLTLTDRRTGAVINNRNAQNALNANGVTVDTTSNPPTGALVWKASAADNPIVNSEPNLEDGAIENHEAVFAWTWTDGTNQLSNQQKVYIDVEKYAMTMVPNESGAGPDKCTISMLDSSGNPIVGADIWVTSDAAGQTRVSGTLTTDQYGNAPFKLTNGSVYYLWMTKAGLQPINGQQFTAQKD